MTAIPVIETQANDISAYIPTNVISITDGQIFLETDLFFQGIRPAVNVGNSVSRVGGSAQTKAMKKVTGKIKLELAQYNEVVKFSQFSSDLDLSTKRLLEKGKRWVEILKQARYEAITTEDEIVSLFAVGRGFLDTVPVSKIKECEKLMIAEAKKEIPSVLENIRTNKDLSDDDINVMSTFCKEFVDKFYSKSI